MKLGILQCDEITPELIDRFGCYPDMFKTLFKQINPTLTFETFSVYQGHLPAHTEICDAYLITGSRHGVYDQIKWLTPFQEFLWQLHKDQCKTVGICFGHQLVGQTFGGIVEKSKKGWGVGLSVNPISNRKQWMEPYKKQLKLLVSHQDQLISLPENAEILAGSEFCPNYLVQYSDHILTVQGHPEFTADYLEALIEQRRGHIIPEKRAKEALSSLSGQTDNLLMARWILNFLFDHKLS